MRYYLRLATRSCRIQPNISVRLEDQFHIVHNCIIKNERIPLRRWQGTSEMEKTERVCTGVCYETGEGRTESSWMTKCAQNIPFLGPSWEIIFKTQGVNRKTELSADSKQTWRSEERDMQKKKTSDLPDLQSMVVTLWFSGRASIECTRQVFS